MAEMQLRTIDSLNANITPAETQSVRSADLEEMFSRHSPILYKVALRTLGNPADAEDAVQDGLLSAFKHFGQFKGDAQISTWLTSIVLNAARMQLRRRSNRHFISLDEHGEQGDCVWPEVLRETGPDPEEIVRRMQVRGILERIAAKLSPKIRLAFQLCILEGLTSQEAAKRLGIGVGTLKGRLFRARLQVTPLLRRSLISPAQSRKRGSAAPGRNFSRVGAAISPESSRDRRLASSVDAQ